MACCHGVLGLKTNVKVWFSDAEEEGEEEEFLVTRITMNPICTEVCSAKT